MKQIYPTPLKAATLLELLDFPASYYGQGGKFVRVNVGASAIEFGTIADADIPAGIARDSEVTDAFTAHTGAADPHAGYVLESAHDKVAHDALNIDADLLDGLHAAQIVTVPAGNEGEVQYNNAGVFGACDGFLWVAGKGFTLGGGAAIDAAADKVGIWAADYAAGDARLHIQSESGNPIIIGNNEAQLWRTVGADYERAVLRWGNPQVRFHIKSEYGGAGSQRGILLDFLSYYFCVANVTKLLLTSTDGLSSYVTILLSNAIGVPVAAADFVRMGVADYATGDARLYLQSELGNSIILGKNEAQFYNVAGTDYERAYLRWDSNIFKIGTEAGGAGTERSIIVYLGSTQLLNLAGLYNYLSDSWVFCHSTRQGWEGCLYPVVDANYDIGASSKRVRALYANQFLSYNAIGDDYERAFLRWDTNRFDIGTEKGGAGVQRTICFRSDISLGIDGTEQRMVGYTLGLVNRFSGAGFGWRDAAGIVPTITSLGLAAGEFGFAVCLTTGYSYSAAQEVFRLYQGGNALFRQGANAQALGVKSLTELTTIAADDYTETAIQIPVNAIVLGVSVRVTVVIPTAVTFDVGIDGAATRYGTGISTAANTTWPGTNDGLRYYSVAAPIRITPNVPPADNTGRVRVTIHYIDITPPTS